MRSSVALLEQLFFDLVFVFAVSQLAHHLHDEFFWRGPPRAARKWRYGLRT
ncbi:low temperature requirement protein A [Streptomyces nigra]|uniref:low temperature requirement protein A n=1 Tax=Streptomyces nigra TaxID=1827580 RepID=UPI0038137D1E